MVDHFVESQQLDKSLIFSLFQRADHLRKGTHDLLKGKVLATLFYEPSTRTRLSFESAMLKLGGQVITTENAKEFSSTVKGESMEDTIRVVSSYADCIVIRHFEDGAAKRAAAISSVPVINAGDGRGQHPTQALLDVYTIYRELHRLDNLKIVMVGDLAHGRTARSLSYLLGKFQGCELIFVSPEHMKIGNDIKEYLDRHQTQWREETELNKVLPEADIVYLTRIQRERMSQEDYENGKGKYVITHENLKLVKPAARILHPLPHVEEINIPLEIEQTDPRVAYFRQAENGLYIRMALLEMLLNKRIKKTQKTKLI
ncbi:aspartate carbamoyltransferase [Candidatus Woesearchaeota archaeon]|nr:aspartate carbamoyltransferase [Candidatus Woesearchaeota archaeon]